MQIKANCSGHSGSCNLTRVALASVCTQFSKKRNNLAGAHPVSST
jgi:hypothetical protein